MALAEKRRTRRLDYGALAMGDFMVAWLAGCSSSHHGGWVDCWLGFMILLRRWPFALLLVPTCWSIRFFALHSFAWFSVYSLACILFGYKLVGLGGRWETWWC
ncbi:hypothetical protein VTJ04DRAFT_3730 [Mycothermus thermophilus]|uniref:uncharacterized protein n=1 Tax=Humicola insolens TaxID=85995 RepID=UPI00374484E5